MFGNSSIDGVCAKQTRRNTHYIYGAFRDVIRVPLAPNAVVGGGGGGGGGACCGGGVKEHGQPFVF